MTKKERRFSLFGYATGDYTNKCGECGNEFQGDKRAFMCLQCAAYEAAKFIASGGHFVGPDEIVVKNIDYLLNAAAEKDKP